MSPDSCVLSERNRNLDFSVLNEEEAVRPGSLVLNLERNWYRDCGIPRMWAGQLPVCPVVFFFLRPTPRNYNSLASVTLTALSVTSFSAALSARVLGTLEPNRGLPQPRPLHPSPRLLSPRGGGDARTTPPGVRRAHPAYVSYWLLGN